MKIKLLFVITQFYKGGAETVLLNLFKMLDPQRYEVDFLVFDQIKLPGTAHLMDDIPPWVNVCDAAAAEPKPVTFIKKVVFRIYRKLTNRQLYRWAAYRFVSGKKYDYAFSWGEWMPPQFVAEKVSASKKAVWIHTDLDKSFFINEKILFGYMDDYERFVFVSNRSRDAALAKYPFLRGKDFVVGNICDDALIRELAQEPLPVDYFDRGLPVIVTVANVRPEKQHLRQAEAMSILKSQGFDFIWVNVGNTANAFLKAQIEAKAAACGLADRFILAGSDENPYRWMARADAVAVLSEYESWSMVITEAKALGVPVVATATSGALEQLEDGANGLICEFDARDIAEKVKSVLSDKALQGRIRSSLDGFSSQSSAMSQLQLLLEEGTL